MLKIEKQRRSIYHLGRDVKLSNDDIVNLIKKAIKLAPTPFNSQSVRAVIVTGKAQEKLWDVISQSVQDAVGQDKYQKGFAPKIHSFKAAYGTALFYTDVNVVKQMAKQVTAFPAITFSEWAEQAQGNAQSAVWNALAEQHVGASIHHYASLLGQDVAKNIAKQFKIPSDWWLRTEMVFGSIEKPAHPKTFIDDQKRFKVFK
ncbi:MAG: nitroreductase family protein [Acetilactobacillus jinshanensis]